MADDASSGSYLPVTSNDASRQQQVARSFYLLGDFLRGMDNVYRAEPQNVNDTGLLGPSSGGTDVGVGQGGEVYVRGQAGQVAATQNAPPVSAPVGPLGVRWGNMQPQTVLFACALLAAGWWLMRKA